MFEIADKVVLVTGGLGGIGSAYVKAFLKENIKGIALLDITDTNLEQLLCQLSQNDKLKVHFIKCDVTSLQQLNDAYKKTIEIFSQLDIVINNAGIFNENDYEKTVNVNFVSTVHSTCMALRDYLPKYKKGIQGVIVNTSSIAGLAPMESCPIYSATKTGILTLTTAFGTEGHYKTTQVRLMTICPSLTDTQMIVDMETPDDYQDILKDKIQSHMPSVQSTDSVANVLMEIIKNGENGSIWLSQNNKPAIKVDLQKYHAEIEKIFAP